MSLASVAWKHSHLVAYLLQNAYWQGTTCQALQGVKQNGINNQPPFFQQFVLYMTISEGQTLAEI